MFPDSILHLKTTASTQDDLRRIAGGENRCLVWSNRQTRGRGRRDRSWESEAGGIYYSLSFRSPRDIEPPMAVLIACYCWAQLLSDRFSSLDFQVKWPNDLLCGGRKLGGALSETVDGQVLLGMGLNVNNSVRTSANSFRRPATSLIDERAETSSRRQLLFAWIRNFFTQLGSGVPKLQVLEDQLATLESWVETDQGGGRAVGLAVDGGLKLKTPNGETRVVYANEIMEIDGGPS